MPISLNDKIFNNTLLSYLLFLAVLAVTFTVIKIAACFFTKHLERFFDGAADSAVSFWIREIRKYIKPVLYFIAVYWDTKILNLPAAAAKIISICFLAFITVMTAVFLSSIVSFFLGIYWRYKDKSEDDTLALKLLTNILKAVIWTVVLILFLDNIGVKINSLLAGLGIGGLAVAFAAQTILNDLFCFFSIFFDKPFKIGDYIAVGEQAGTVEHIGMKTTRLRSPDGEELICSNSDLMSSRIRNYKTMEKRRVLFVIGVTYHTPVEKLKMIPGLIRSIVESIQGAEFGRAHFSAYGPYSLNFEIVYYIHSGNYDEYMDISQEVNFQIKEQFDQRGIAFAFPTQSVQLQMQNVPNGAGAPEADAR